MSILMKGLSQARLHPHRSCARPCLESNLPIMRLRGQFKHEKQGPQQRPNTAAVGSRIQETAPVVQDAEGPSGLRFPPRSAIDHGIARFRKHLLQLTTYLQISRRHCIYRTHMPNWNLKLHDQLRAGLQGLASGHFHPLLRRSKSFVPLQSDHACRLYRAVR